MTIPCGWERLQDCFIFSNGRFREIPLPGPDPSIETRCVLKDRSGRLWIGTYGAGLFCRQQGTVKRYSKADRSA